MILRFYSRDGQFRLNVQPTDTFSSILPQLAEKLPKNADLSTLTLANNAQQQNNRSIKDVADIAFEVVGKKW